MSQQPYPTTTSLIRLLQGVTPLLSSLTAGLSLSISVILVPRLLESPSPLMLRQWHASFHQGKKLILSLGGVSALGYFILAGSHYFTNLNSSGISSSSRLVARIYLTAAILTLSIAPYTRTIMWGTNEAIIKKGKEMNGSNWTTTTTSTTTTSTKVADQEQGITITEEQEKGAKYLVDHWGLLNLGRAALISTAAVLGLSAAYI